MKSVLTKMAVLPVLFMALAFAVQGTASAHTVTTNHQTVSASAAVPLACPPTISEGSPDAAAVRELQGALNELYRDFDDPSWYEMSPDSFTYPLHVDGSFGPQTLHAVIDFQSWNPLTVDGIVGPNTWHYLHKC